MPVVYNILYAFAFALYLPVMLIRGKWHAGFITRFGNLPRPVQENLNRKKCIWIHAVSIGEVLAVVGLIGQLRDILPQYTLVCSTVTKTGQKVARERLQKDVVVIYAPLDFSRSVRKYITAIKPEIYISTETEIWPNLYRLLHNGNIPIIQINGRISDSAFRGYRRAGLLVKQVLACVNLFYMQSRLDAQRIVELGADPSNVHVAGNLKFDYAPEPVALNKETLGFCAHEDLLIAGSTHPGEEEILVDVYGRLKIKFPHLRLVIAPRHVERVNEIVRLIGGRGYKAVLYSRILEDKPTSDSIVVVDTLGDLRGLYSLAKVVFVGKSLKVGGP